MKVYDSHFPDAIIACGKPGDWAGDLEVARDSD